jgi:CHASE2 domain-containing sensor protein
MLLALFLWACFASVLALVRRPQVGVRAGLIVATWFAAAVLSFI